MYSNLIQRLSFLSLFLFIVLLPVFFLPFTTIPVEASKSLFLVIGLVVSVIFWIVLRFSDGRIMLPKSLCLLAGGAVVLVTFLSAIFSGASVSLFGVLLDIGTFWFVFCCFLLMLLSSVTFREIRSARLVLFGTIFFSALVLIFQFIRLFIPRILSFGLLPGKIDNIIGSWNAFGIFAGFFVIASLLLIEFFPVTRRLKILFGALSLLALLLIAIVNFSFVWTILGVFSLLIFVYKISMNAKRNQEEANSVRFPIFSFVVVILSLLFFMSSSFLGGILPSKFGIVSNEVSPSLTATLSITTSVLRHDPLLGLGPNRFADAWALYKQNSINATQFWDVSFTTGSGVLPTFIATTGALGILAWAAFIIIFVVAGVRWLFLSIKNNVSLETVSFFFLALYLFCSSFFYFTGTVIFLLAFVFAGVFIGLVASNRANGEISISFFNDHRKSFFFMLFLVILLILSVAIGFKYIERFASLPYFARTLTATNIADAETSIGRALSLNTNDLYLRTYSQVYLLKLNSIISTGGTSLSEADRAVLQSSLDQAVNSAQLAITHNPKNYLNFQMLGTVYETAGLIGVGGGYERAFEAYSQASLLNPANPRLKLILANISNALERTKDAKEYANQALELKPDYIDALIFLSQIARREGNTTQAISYAGQALSLSPGNEGLAQYLNSLRTGTTTTADEQATSDSQ